jgi:hypothetical protein
MKKDQDMKHMLKQIQALTKKIEYMEKELHEIRKGNVIGAY